MSLTKISNLQSKLVDAIRQQCREQVELWKQVPGLALNADGRTGYNDQVEYLIEYHVWRLKSSNSGGYYRAGVDIHTGEIVRLPMRSNATREDFKASDDDTVLSIEIEDIDVEAIIADLTEKGKQPVGSYYNAEANRQQRKERAAKIEGLPHADELIQWGELRLP